MGAGREEQAMLARFYCHPRADELGNKLAQHEESWCPRNALWLSRD
jgi:hypothetical protein